MSTLPATAATQREESAAPIMPLESPVGRLLRRPSDRFRRERPRERRYKLAVRLAEVVSRVVSWMPDLLRDWLADRAGDLWIRTTPVYRANVIANLGQVMGPRTPRPELEAMARGIFRMSARNFGELLRVRHLSPAELIALVPLSAADLAVLREARARGQGVIIATAHMGPFDLLGHAIAAQGVPMTVITGRTTSRFVFDAVTHLRHSHDIRMVEPTPGGVRRVIKALRQGEISCFLADYDFFQNGIRMTFFGRETTLPPGTIRIARDTGALVIPMFPRRTGDGYKLTVGEPFEVAKTRDVDADVLIGMEILKSRLEAGIGANPDQWVLFQRAWPLEPAPPVRVFPVGSPLESELLKRVDAVLPPRHDDGDGGLRQRSASRPGDLLAQSVGFLRRIDVREWTSRAVDTVRRKQGVMMNILAIRDRILSFSFRRRKDPIVEMLESAPLDDEPVTEDDLRSLEEGWQDYLAGRYVTSDEVKRKYREQATRR